MSLSNASENHLIDHLFNNVAYANIGDASGLPASAAAGFFYISLHTSDPGEAGDQTTNEISYTGYGRVAVARSSAGFTVSGSSASNTAAVTFGTCTAGSGTATHFVIGRASSGAGEIIFSGALNASLAISAGITPQFAIGALSASFD